MNDQNNNQVYYTPQPEPEKKGAHGVCIAALICGIVAMCCCNPGYLVSIAATVLGGIGLGKKYEPRGMAIAGLILGISSLVICLILDIILIPFTFGASFLF